MAGPMKYITITHVKIAELLGERLNGLDPHHVATPLPTDIRRLLTMAYVLIVDHNLQAQFQ